MTSFTRIRYSSRELSRFSEVVRQKAVALSRAVPRNTDTDRWLLSDSFVRAPCEAAESGSPVYRSNLRYTHHAWDHRSGCPSTFIIRN